MLDIQRERELNKGNMEEKNDGEPGKVWEGFDSLSAREKEGVIQDLKSSFEEKLGNTDPKVKEILVDNWESMVRVAAGVAKPQKSLGNQEE